MIFFIFIHLWVCQSINQFINFFYPFDAFSLSLTIFFKVDLLSLDDDDDDDDEVPFSSHSQSQSQSANGSASQKPVKGVPPSMEKNVRFWFNNAVLTIGTPLDLGETAGQKKVTLFENEVRFWYSRYTLSH